MIVLDQILMHLFTNYIQPLIQWLQHHPSMALMFTFMLAFCESVVIIGTLIPGSFGLTALGVLAGSGIMSISLTYIAAIGGAILGDGLSYVVGILFSEQLPLVWPFCRHPQWIHRGVTYFNKHGGKSLIAGRFFGPLRSVIPMIAGMMHMSALQFMIANVVSGIIWAGFYITPGVLIGAVGSELSPDQATRFFLMLLCLVIALWFLSRLMFLLIKNLKQRFEAHAMHNKNNRIINYWSSTIPGEPYPTLIILYKILLCTFCLMLCLALFIVPSISNNVNIPLEHLLKSYRSTPIDEICMMMYLTFSKWTQGFMTFIIGSYFIFKKNWRMLGYWFSLCLISSLFINHPIIPATALLAFWVLQTNSNYFYARIITAYLFFFGLVQLILNTQHLLPIFISYGIGYLLALFHWLGYRRKQEQIIPLPSGLMLLAFLMALMVHGMANHSFPLKKYDETNLQYRIDHQAWWDNAIDNLPQHITNRLGSRIGLFNLQYDGHLEFLTQKLENLGWKKQTPSFFYAALMRSSGQKSREEYPLIAPIYLNQKPLLTLSYASKKHQAILILRLWASNYYFADSDEPLYLGSIMPISSSESKTSINEIMPVLNSSFSGLEKVIYPFPEETIKTLHDPLIPVLFKIDAKNTKLSF